MSSVAESPKSSSAVEELSGVDITRTYVHLLEQLTEGLKAQNNTLSDKLDLEKLRYLRLYRRYIRRGGKLRRLRAKEGYQADDESDNTNDDVRPDVD